MTITQAAENWSTTLAACRRQEACATTPLHCDAPATERTVRKVERRIGQSLPPALRDVFTTFSQRFGFEWALGEPLRLPTALVAERIWGGFREIGLQNLPTLVDLVRDLNSELRKHGAASAVLDALPFYALGNGDFLATDNQGAVIYLAYESVEQHGALLGRGFVTFMYQWSRIGCIGPEIWLLEPFLGREGLDPESEASRRWRTQLFAGGEA
jgi:hypothetical protein